MQYCSLHHQTLLLSPVTSTAGFFFFLLRLHPFILSAVISPLISSSILGTYLPGEFIFQCQIFLPFHTVHGVLKARILKQFAICFSSGILGTYLPGEFIFQCLIFSPLHTVHGVLKARILKYLPSPSAVDHTLSELSTMTHPSWVALYSMAHSLTELDKAVVHVISLVSFLWLWFLLCLPSDGYKKSQ